MANNDRARKLLVRSALVTSTTIATFVGAQNLAMVDTNQFAEATAAPPPAATPLPVQHVAPDMAIQQAVPSIIILRRAGESGGSPATPLAAPAGAPAVVLPQAQIVVPNPVIVPQPIQQQSRSTR